MCVCKRIIIKIIHGLKERLYALICLFSDLPNSFLIKIHPRLIEFSFLRSLNAPVTRKHASSLFCFYYLSNCRMATIDRLTSYRQIFFCLSVNVQIGICLFEVQ